MKLRHDIHADGFRAANPDALLATDVTVGELVEFLSRLPPSMVVHSWDCYNDDRSTEILVDPDTEENRVTITG